jgi:phytoene dehydrogenase-like protein
VFRAGLFCARSGGFKVADKSVIIIGAGIAGLSTGIYGQINGYKTQIFEMGIKPGGLCTSWQRKGYIIDGCLHWLVGTSAKSSYHSLWQEIGALQDKKVIDLEIFSRYESPDGKTVTVYSDVDKLASHFKEIAPEDSAFIDEFAAAIRHFSQLDIPADKAPELYSPLDKIKMITRMGPYMSGFNKWGKITMQEFAAKFQNTLLREAWLELWPPEFSSVFMLMTLGWLHAKNAGYVIGGSLELSLNIEKRYCDLGGKINYKSGVEKILVEDGRAVGIKLSNGTEHKADYVISAADGHSAIWDMLDGKFVDETVEKYYKMPLFKPLVYIGLGVNRTFSDLPQMVGGLIFPVDKPIMVGNKEHKRIGVQIYNFDSTYAAEGKTALKVMFETDFAYWQELRQDDKKYKAEKEKIAVAVVSALNKRFPGFSNQLEMWDVATPMTFYRYTGNWQGSYEGFLMTPENMTLQMRKTLPGLDNFYMVGQWVSPGGGLPSGLVTGNQVIQILCKREKRKFKSTAA